MESSQLFRILAPSRQKSIDFDEGLCNDAIPLNVKLEDVSVLQINTMIKTYMRDRSSILVIKVTTKKSDSVVPSPG